jgi:DNA-directed RNA polymerase specialized sigma24 family protein
VEFTTEQRALRTLGSFRRFITGPTAAQAATEQNRILCPLNSDFDDHDLKRSLTSRYERSLEGTIGKTKLRKMLRSLSSDQWETLRLHFFEGYTLSEIAQKKGNRSETFATISTEALKNFGVWPFAPNQKIV